MNEQLVELLREGGVTRPLAWHDLLVVQNYSPLPPPKARAGKGSNDRGINLVVLDGSTPSHFCKCRPRDEANLRRETAARNCLADVRSGLRVPPAIAASSETLTVQVSRFLTGVQYGGVARGQTSAGFVEAVRSMLEGLGRLADRAVESCGDVVRLRGAFSLKAESTECLAYLVPVLDLDGDALQAVSTVLADAGDLPARPQHADLWWRNVIVVDDEYWAVDLEDYGDLCVPLYDDLTLLISTFSLRHPSAPGGLEALCGDTAEAVACRSVLSARAASEAVTPEQMDGILTYHVLRRACFVHGRAGPVHAAPHLNAARYVIERLVRGDRGLLSTEAHS